MMTNISSSVRIARLVISMAILVLFGCRSNLVDRICHGCPVCIQECLPPETCGGGGTEGVCGATYYVAASGGADSANGLEETSAWATLDRAWEVVGPGDTVALLNGTYNLSLTVATSGEPGSPLRVVAATDGGAFFDGQGILSPCAILGTAEAPVHDVVVEGVRCAHSSDAVFNIAHATAVTLRRVTAHHANHDSSAQSVFRVRRSDNILLEDVAAWDIGPTLFFFDHTRESTLRRCWGRFDASNGSYRYGVLVESGSHNLIENCVVFSAAASPTNVYGFLVASSESTAADNNRFLGSVAQGVMDWGFGVITDRVRFSGNEVMDTIVLDTERGFFQRSDAALVVDRLTIAEMKRVGFTVRPDELPKDADFSVGGEIRNSSFSMTPSGINVISSPHITTIGHHSNNFWSVATVYSGTSSGANETTIDPIYDTATYGAGAYLLGSTVLANANAEGGRIGAQIIYQSVGGMLTNIPLWPWPMEDRISRETGNSVTWADRGGLWTTLEGVYDDFD